MAAPASRLVAKIPVPDSTNARLSSPYVSTRLAVSPRNKKYYWNRCCCSLSMNGCGGGAEHVEICETRVLSPVFSIESAIPQLYSAISALDADSPTARSGIIRLEVPIQKKAEAIGWLQSHSSRPHCFFSGRDRGLDSAAMLNGGVDRSESSGQNLVSVAGVGSAVHFTRLDPFSLEDWRSIKRFLSEDCPLIRAYGAIRFDPGRYISSEWRQFGSFYFVIPQVEFNEHEGSSTLATNIAWDEGLQWPWQKARDSLHFSLSQITPTSPNTPREIPATSILSSFHTPNRVSWEIAVKKALQIIDCRSSELVKVVLARSSRIVTDTGMDPVTLLACLLVEGQNAYQFSIQPPNAPAFIGNTPEQLFHRKHLYVSSEALAGTRARGASKAEDLQIEHDLLLSPKDDIEFTIVRESIRSKLEVICNEVVVEPSKAIRKLPRVQHLSAQLTARLRNTDDEVDLQISSYNKYSRSWTFNSSSLFFYFLHSSQNISLVEFPPPNTYEVISFGILSSLHPSPAVCGLPTEEARRFIAETENFDRGMYAGPVGWFGGNESEFAVGIRSALVEKGAGIYIYAGAGIVEGTNPLSEWEELDLKSSQFTKLLQHGTLSFAGRR